MQADLHIASYARAPVYEPAFERAETCWSIQFFWLLLSAQGYCSTGQGQRHRRSPTRSISFAPLPGLPCSTIRIEPGFGATDISRNASYRGSHVEPAKGEVGVRRRFPFLRSLSTNSSHSRQQTALLISDCCRRTGASSCQRRARSRMLFTLPVNGQLTCRRLSQSLSRRLSTRAQLVGPAFHAMSASLAKRVPTAKLSSGHTIPLLGLGTSGLSGVKATEATHEALDLGYKVRHEETFCDPR